MLEHIPVLLRSHNHNETLYGILLVSEQIILARSSKGEVDREIASPDRQSPRYTISTLERLGWNVLPLTRVD